MCHTCCRIFTLPDKAQNRGQQQSADSKRKEGQNKGRALQELRTPHRLAMSAVAHDARFQLRPVCVLNSLDAAEPPRALTIYVFAYLAGTDHPARAGLALV
jgi:hypothetical protein